MSKRSVLEVTLDLPIVYVITLIISVIISAILVFVVGYSIMSAAFQGLMTFYFLNFLFGIRCLSKAPVVAVMIYVAIMTLPLLVFLCSIVMLSTWTFVLTAMSIIIAMLIGIVYLKIMDLI